jgi:hypothetical protein
VFHRHNCRYTIVKGMSRKLGWILRLVNELVLTLAAWGILLGFRAPGVLAAFTTLLVLGWSSYFLARQRRGWDLADAPSDLGYDQLLYSLMRRLNAAAQYWALALFVHSRGIGSPLLWERLLPFAASAVLLLSAAIGRYRAQGPRRWPVWAVLSVFCVGVFALPNPWTAASDQVWLETRGFDRRLFGAAAALLVACGVSGYGLVPSVAITTCALLIPTAYAFVLYQRLRSGFVPRPLAPRDVASGSRSRSSGV